MKKEKNSAAIVCRFKHRIQELSAEVSQIADGTGIETDAKCLIELESRLQSLHREISDLKFAIRLQQALDSHNTILKALELIKAIPKKFKSYGLRLVSVRMANGTIVEILTTYFARPCHEKRATKRGIGCYPALLVLGIFDKCSPSLASEVSKTAAALASIKEAQDMLAARGCELDTKTIRNIVKRYAGRARACQEGGEIYESIDISNRRVVISIDGGRTRIRKNKKGPKTEKKRRRYHAEWREPKLFVIYVIDEHGNKDRRFNSLMDASLKGPDYTMALLEFYLRKMRICLAKSVTFVADGATWIWDRTTTLLIELGLKAEQIHYILDFYHAAQHLSNLLEKLKWPASDRKSYFTKYRRILLKGKTDDFFDFVESISRRSRNKEVIRERQYFAKHRERMRYQQFSSQNLPLGSGAVESAIRRVINMRLKGPGIFWHEDTANEMLMLRCYYKANRWEMLNKMASSCAAIGMSR
jgi:hypothetical protein